MNVQHLSISLKQVTFYYTKRSESILEGLVAASLWQTFV